MENTDPTQNSEIKTEKIKLDLDDLDLGEIDQLNDTVLGNLLREIKEDETTTHARHSSHSSYTAHGTAAW